MAADKQHQPAYSVEEQVENLKTKNLIIDNEDHAKKFLSDVSYFRFIKAYSLNLKERNGDYHDGVTFDQLVELYQFNSEFRQLLFPLIETIEINLRSRTANHFCLTYGVLGYNDAFNFNDHAFHQEFLIAMSREISHNKRSPFIKNFRDNYDGGHMPFYALIEIMTFGSLSKFYGNLHAIDQKKIASQYKVHRSYFASWIQNIAHIRNVCAHYGRLYNAKFSIAPKLYPEHIKDGISGNKIFGTLLCMKQLLPNDTVWKQFIENIELLLAKYPHVDIQLMGFPDELWKYRLL